MLNTSFSPWPSFTEDEAKAVSRVLTSNRVNYWTGSEGREFEAEFAEFSGANYAVAVSNGSVALELALRSLGVGPGDEVIVTSRTFLASASSIVAAGAEPIFADVDRDSQNITADSVAPLISERTKAIVAVHLAGWPCEMDGLMALARSRQLSVIEDCAQAHGAKYKGRSVGSIGDVAAWSFCQDKIMTTGGEGGMVTTNDRALWLKMWSYKDHGKSWDAVYHKSHAPGFRWLHESFGTNWRMTEMQAAIGRIQLKRMKDWSEQRQRNCRLIWDAAAKFDALRVPAVPDSVVHAGYKCYVFVDSEKLKGGWSRDRVIAAINQEGVPCMSGSCSEVYLEKCFLDSGLSPSKRLPVAKELGDTSLMFLVHPTLSESELARTKSAIETVMNECSI